MFRNRGDEGYATEKPKTRITSSLSPRGAKLREELLSKILPWQEITLSLDNFPYYIQEHAKSLVVECVASNLKPNKLRKYCDSFDSSNGRILLQTVPGGELYRERLVSAVAREMKVPLLRLDDDHGCDEEKEWRKDNIQSCMQSYQQYYNRNKVVAVTFKKGDRVKYVGSKNISFEELNNRTLWRSQRGEVYEVKGNTVAVVFNISGLTKEEAERDEKDADVVGQAIVIWLHENDVRQDDEVRLHDCYIAMEVLYEVLKSQRPMIVYFADSFLWPPKSDEIKEFLWMVKNIFNQLPDGVVMICPKNNWNPGLDNEEARLGYRLEFPEPLKKFIDRIPRSSYTKSELYKLFSNVVCIKPPMYGDLLETFVEQIEEDRLIVVSDANLRTMHKVLKEYNLSCINLEHPIIEDMILKRKKVEKIIGWAINHYFSSCPVHCVNEEKLNIPLDSIKLAILRFMEEQNYTPTPRPKKKLNSTVKDLASGGSEEALVSAVVCAEDISMKFDDVGVLENVKKTLYETVILPMRRPELFSHGNLLRSCKGILLFGPPGTGKTLIAKALTKESGAHFINITAPTFASMSFHALFSFASKLDPVIIYLDEMETFDGARGRDKYGKSKLNEFIEAWDRWKSKESQRILLIGATNRPFDIDEAVIRQMPRRIYVGLPDLENRSKILKLILNKKNLEPEFSFDQLAEATEGYSGSDLKNLCIAAAYGPIEEFVEQKSKGEASDGAPAFRPLNLNDFIHSKSKVRPSVVPNSSINMKLREWKEQYGEGESQRLQRI